MEVYERIKELREKKRLSQYDMADMLNISQSAYLQIEKGKTELSITRAKQIASVLEVSISDLLGIETAKEETALQKKINDLQEEIERQRKMLDMCFRVSKSHYSKLQELYEARISLIQHFIISAAVSKGILTKDRSRGLIFFQNLTLKRNLITGSILDIQ